MRIIFTFVFAIAFALSVAFAVVVWAQEQVGSNPFPTKTTPSRIYVSPPEHRQGGDTIADAILIADLPFFDTGTTEGYVDDYDEVCPYTGSTSPDVVYRIETEYSRTITVDLCGSQYDTKLYIYDADLNVIACNDDFYFGDPCGTYVSRLEFIQLIGGGTYYIVVDGYGGEAGSYQIHIPHFGPCFVHCPPDAVPEGEPYLHDGYLDQHNGGCNSVEFGTPLQDIDWTNDPDGIPPYDGAAMLCGKSGWYQNAEGDPVRDTDWFRVFARETGLMEVTLHPDFDCQIMKLATPDCENLAYDVWATATCLVPGTLTFPVTAGQEIWLRVGPLESDWPTFEFTYFMTVTNNQFDVVPDEKVSWGEVKALYR